MCPLAEIQQRCQRSLCLHEVSKPWFSCYFRPWQFLCDSFFVTTMPLKYLVHLPSLYRIQCLEIIYMQECYLEVFGTNSFDDLTDCQNLWSFGWIFPKTVLIFLRIFLNFWFDAIEKQSLIKVGCYGSVMLL